MTVGLSPHAVQRATVPPDRPDPSQRRRQWDERYLSNFRPWDSGITPPEVVAFWRSGLLPYTGLAVDLGCGSGAHSAYLAGLGLRVIGVDLSGIALRRAWERDAGYLAGKMRGASFVQADVALLPLHDAAAHYILDIGCLHSIPRRQRSLYAQGVVDNLRPGGFYHLFAFDRVFDSSSDPEHSDRGVDKDEVRLLFAPFLSLLTVQRGRPDQQPCRWYLLYKRHA
jgi:SAM-dependent methyltransferase